MPRSGFSSRDVFRHHKTTNREIYNRHFNLAHGTGFDEVTFRNECAELAECAISSICLHIDRVWATPALACGVLPGVFRAKLLAILDPVMECNLQLEDLQRADAIVTCNALRGIRPVMQIESATGEVIWQNKTGGSLKTLPDYNLRK